MGAEKPFPIVGIGASAGGLKAFRDLLGSIPASSGMAFVCVAHLDPNHVSELAHILGQATSLPVVQVEEGARVEPDHVYVIPPDTALEIVEGTLHLKPR